MEKIFGVKLLEAMKERTYWVGSYTKNKINGTKYCIWCGTDLKDRRRKYCNDTCRMDFFAEYEIRFVWKEIRKRIFTRDNFTCQDCNTKFKKWWKYLECHHIIPRTEGGKHMDDNLITLCIKCHKIHTKQLIQRLFSKSPKIQTPTKNLLPFFKLKTE